MAGISSVSESSYPYRGTLSRLDANGDGVLSRSEIAAAQRPGILRDTADDEQARAGSYGALIAKLIDLHEGDGGAPAETQGLEAPADDISEAATNAYRNTYGQYEAE